METSGQSGQSPASEATAGMGAAISGQPPASEAAAGMGAAIAPLVQDASPQGLEHALERPGLVTLQQAQSHRDAAQLKQACDLLDAAKPVPETTQPPPRSTEIIGVPVIYLPAANVPPQGACLMISTIIVIWARATH